jgi:hypothetical protein
MFRVYCSCPGVSDELSSVGGEKTIGHVDGDGLFAFRAEAVDQQRIVEGAALGADPGAIGMEAAS